MKPEKLQEMAMRIAAVLFCFLLVSFSSAAAWAQLAIAPYIQLGHSYAATPMSSSFVIRWAAPAVDKLAWSMQVRTGTGDWVTLSSPSHVMIPHGLILFSQPILGATPGSTVDYRLLHGNVPVFQGQTTAPKGRFQNCKIMVMGDCGAGTKSQQRLTRLAEKRHEDLALIAGDVVYEHGTLSEYLAKFFSIYNSPGNGSALMHAVPFAVSPGNHDTCAEENSGDSADLVTFPDGLAYFFVWSEPLNGPILPEGMGPHIQGSKEQIASFLQSSSGSFPRGCNYSFNYGNVHVVSLDSNKYQDWADVSLQNWLEADLLAAQDMPWRIVFFHHAPFSTDSFHFEDQQMRLLAPIFQRDHVSIVFSGHSHTYQRSLPLEFTPADPPKQSPDGFVYGSFRFDKQFDGKEKCSPKGVIYVVTGAGGAELSPIVQKEQERWQPFTVSYQKIHSFTECTFNENEANICQVAETGRAIDSFTIHK